MDLPAFRERFQPVFEVFLHEKCASAAALASDELVQAILRYPEKLAGGEGKRVRPYAAWLLYRAMGGEDREDVFRMLMSLELFHIYALVHDDIIDRGTTRHGVATAHVMVEDALRRDARVGNITHIADGQAILLGDLIFQWSQEVFFSTAGIDVIARERAAVYFKRMIEEVIVGQMIDVDLMTREAATQELINQKMHLKTSSYTFIRPLQIGAALAGASPEVFAWCERFGAAIGRAFQIQDDLLDLTVSSEKTGKTAFSDLQERQHTVFTQFIFEHGTEEQKKELQTVFGIPLTEGDRARVMNLFESSGAIAHGKRLIEKFFIESSQLVDNSPLKDAYRNEVRSVVELIRHRAS